MSLRILRPGLLTTVQDLGRFGYQQAGIIVSGAMDALALRVGNLLVGNPETAAGLEITLLGPRIRFNADSLIALTGAHLSPTLHGQPVALNRAVWVAAGTELAFGPAEAGCRTYLAVAGGVAVPMVLGSRSTYLRAGFGGQEGRALRAGDVLPVGEPSPVGARLKAQLARPGAAWAAARFTPAPTLGPRPHYRPVLRTVRGPEYDQFSIESQRALWAEAFTISPQADRMGYRLQGPPLARLTDPELLSSAVTFGTVQVPNGGQPIVLGADHQTTGGYPRLAQVISVDWPALAQAVPGQALRFQEVSVREAHALYAARERAVARLARGMAQRVNLTP